jgi:hypothetical protein
MSYTYLLEQGEESSAASFSAIPAYALSKSKSIPAKSCCSGSATDACHDSQSGTTSPHSTATPGEAASMSSAAVSRAKTSAQPEKAPESQEPEADSGAKWQGSFAKFDPDSCSWKTHQCSLLGGWEPFSETWPRWGSMRGGACWELATPARLTSGSGSGSWPTPRCQMTRPVQVRKDIQKGHKGNLEEVVAVRMLWPTPHGFSKDGKSNGPSGNELGRAVNQRQMWPTPQASDNRDRGNLSDPSIQRRIKMGKQINLSMQVKETAHGGSLNPTWVEWLMGWPLAWTDLKPLEMDKFRQWRLSHGKS